VLCPFPPFSVCRTCSRIFFSCFLDALVIKPFSSRRIEGSFGRLFDTGNRDSALRPRSRVDDRDLGLYSPLQFRQEVREPLSPRDKARSPIPPLPSERRPCSSLDSPLRRGNFLRTSSSLSSCVTVFFTVDSAYGCAGREPEFLPSNPPPEDSSRLDLSAPAGGALAPPRPLSVFLPGSSRAFQQFSLDPPFSYPISDRSRASSWFRLFSL